MNKTFHTLAVLALAATTALAAEPLLLQWGTIDTASASAQAESASLKAKVAQQAARTRARKTAAAEERAAYIVQFPGPVTGEWRTWLESSTQVRGYLPEFAYLVWATAAEMETIAANPAVHWTGEWKTAYKTVRARSAAADSSLRQMHVMSLLAGDDGAAGLRGRLVSMGIAVDDAFPRLDGSAAVAWLTGAQIDAIASWPDIEWIEPVARLRICNDQAARSNMMNVSNAWASLASGGLGLTGAGQIVAVADTGLDKGSATDTHDDFAGRVLAGYPWTNGAYKADGDWADYYAHGTHCCGSLLGSGGKSGGQYRGMAWEASLVMQGLSTSVGVDEDGEEYEYLSGLPADTKKLLRQAYTNGARIHSDSWGGGNAGEYSGSSLHSDSFMWTNQNFLMVVAAGNAGIDADGDGVIDPNSIGQPGTAKNCLCVGAAENYRSTGGYAAQTYGGKWPSDYPADPIKGDKISRTTSPQGLAAFSGRGPTADGRIKPDIVAPGTDVISARSRSTSRTGWGVVSGNTNYLYMGGTSMATPLVAGACALVRQWLVERKGIAEPPAALMKALLINGARDMTPGQYGTGSTQEITARPDRSQGFGHVNLYDSLEPGDGRFLHFATNTIAATYGEFTTNLVVGATDVGPYRITLAWQDYPGKSSAAKALVNDLDLIVTSPAGTRFHPNALGAADHTNNIESVEFTAHETGTWTVRVYGNEIAQAAPHGGQPFALVLSGPKTTIVDEAPEFRSPSATDQAVLGEDYLFDFATLLSTRGYPEPTFAITSTLPGTAYETADSLISFTPNAPGSFDFTCVASNTVGTSTCTLTVTVPFLPPAVPSGLGAADISSTAFTAVWSPVPAADAYDLDLAAVTASGGNTNLLEENFTGFTATSYASTLATQTVASGTWTYSNVIFRPGEPANGTGSAGVAQLKAADGLIILPPIDDPATLTVVSRASSGALTLQQEISGSWTTIASWSLTTNGAAYTHAFTNAGPAAALRFKAGAKATYIHDLAIAAPAATYASLDGYPRTVGAATNVPLAGLRPSTDYAIRVRATNAAGASAWTDWFPVATDAGDFPPAWTGIPSYTLEIPVATPYELDLAACVSGHPDPAIHLDSATADSEEYLFEDGYLVFTPAGTNTYTFVFTASNTLGTASATLRLRAKGTRPSLDFGFDPDETTLETAIGESVEFTVAATGAPAPVLSVACTNAVEDEEYIFYPDTGEFLFEPVSAGTYEFIFTAANAAGRATATVTVRAYPGRITVPTLAIDPDTLSTNAARATWTHCIGVENYHLQLASDDRFTASSASVTATNLFDNPADSATAPDGWIYDIDSASSSYLILRHGHSVVSEAVDTTACTSLVLSCSMRTYGGTSHPTLLVQYSTDGGANWLDAATTNTTKGTTWIAPAMALPPALAGHASLRLRFASATPSGATAGIGIKSLVLCGDIPAGGGSLLFDGFVEGTSHTFTNLAPDTTYYTRVRGTSEWSTVVAFTTPAAAPPFEQWLADHAASGHDAGETAPNGRTYWDNYIADIDPGDTYLAIQIADPSAGTFTIPAASPNRTYTLLWTTNLSTGDYQQQDLGPGAPSAPIAFPTPGDWYGGLEVALPSDP